MKLTPGIISSYLEFLNELSLTYSDESEEYQALKLGGDALAYFGMKGLLSELEGFIEYMYSDLTEAEIKDMKDRGVEP